MSQINCHSEICTFLLFNTLSRCLLFCEVPVIDLFSLAVFCLWRWGTNLWFSVSGSGVQIYGSLPLEVGYKSKIYGSPPLEVGYKSKIKSMVLCHWKCVQVYGSLPLEVGTNLWFAATGSGVQIYGSRPVRSGICVKESD